MKKNYLQTEHNLYGRKSRLFNEGNANYWELTQDILKKHKIEEIKANKEIAFVVMLPNVFNILLKIH